MQRVYCHGCRAAFQVDGQWSGSCPGCGEGFVELVEHQAPAGAPPFGGPAGPAHTGPGGWSQSFQLPGGGRGYVHVMGGGGAPPALDAPGLERLLQSLLGGAGMPPMGFTLAVPGSGISAGPDGGDMYLDQIVTQIMDQYEPSGQATAERVRRSLPRLRVRPAGGAVPVEGEATCMAGETCAVCHETYVAGAEVLELPCTHCFHPDCIMPWLEGHNTCPVCRLQLPAESGHGLRAGPGAGGTAGGSQRQPGGEGAGSQRQPAGAGGLHDVLQALASGWQQFQQGLAGGTGPEPAAGAGGEPVHSGRQASDPPRQPPRPPMSQEDQSTGPYLRRSRSSWMDQPASAAGRTQAAGGNGSTRRQRPAAGEQEDDAGSALGNMLLGGAIGAVAGTALAALLGGLRRS